jgi:ABC-2 type transport system permease protein
VNLPTDKVTAKIFDQGYRPFSGPLCSLRSRFWVIAVHELRQAWKEKWFRRLVWFAYLPTIFLSIVAVVQAKFSGLIGREPIDIWSSFWKAQVFISMLAVYFVGRNAVGEDIRTGAFVVYFSRPVGFWQYLSGKWVAMAVCIVLVTLLPGSLLAAIRWLADSGVGSIRFLGWIGVLLLLTLLLSLTLGWVMLAVSSLTRRGRAAGIVWLVLFFGLTPLAAFLVKETGSPEFAGVSFTQANVRFGEILLDGKGSAGTGLGLAFWLLCWIGVSIATTNLRLRRFRDL